MTIEPGGEPPGTPVPRPKIPKKAVWAHPWLSLSLTLVVSLALAVVFGLPTEKAQLSLLLGLFILGCGRFLVYRWHKAEVARASQFARRDPSIEVKPKSPVEQFFTVFAGTLLSLFVFTMVRRATFDPKDAAMTAAMHRLQIAHYTAALTEQYWNSHVSRLHHLRFDLPSDPHEGALITWRKQVEAIRLASSQPESMDDFQIKRVDPDLLAMARRHSELDASFIKTYAALLSTTVDSLSASEARGAVERLNLDNLIERVDHASQNKTLSKEATDTWDKAADIQDKYDEAFHDIKVMQATLNERYERQRVKFLLPSLR